LTGLVAFKLIHLADTISRAATLVYERQFGLNNSELRAMIALRDMQPLTIADLSRAGHIDKAWVSRSVASLSDRGLVSREAHPTDQRMALIRLTPAGLDLTRAFEPVAHARQKRLLAGLSQREAFRVIDMLQKNADQLLKEP
jgi:DNA-binding MarR family transcriptional regulator